MKKNFKLFCFGFGQVAKYLVKNLIESNYNFELITTNTSKTTVNEINNLKYKSYYFFNDEYDKELINELSNSSKVLISIPPKKQNDTVLKVFGKNFIEGNFDWVTYLSATSVYGDKKGKWVDEKTNPEPTSDRGIARLNAENSWLNLFLKFKLPVQIFRLSGIYSIENNVIVKIKKDKLKIVNKKNHFFSRIHVEDIAEVLKISLQKFQAGQIYNISDNYPCSNSEIAKYAANLLNVNIPKLISLEEITNSILKDFYKDSKKVDNKKMKDFFQYTLKYPTFKEGLNMIKNHII